MRVLQVINTLDPAGAEMLLFDVSRGLSRRGVESDIWVMRRSGTSLERRFLKAGFRVFGPEGGSLYSPVRALSLWRFLRRNRYDLIHVHLFPSQLWTAIAAGLAFLKIPLVTTEHNTYNRRRKWYFRPLDAWMYARYQEIIAISDATMHALVAWVPGAREKTSVVWNGIRVERFRQASGYPKERVIGEGAPLVISVGRLEEQKAMDVLVRAVAELSGVHLVIVGEGRERPELERLIASLGLQGRVHLLGRRDDVPRLLKTADVYVQASRWEGFGIAAAEAMAAGLPVIASAVPGLAGVVGDAGLLVPPGDVHALAGAIKQVLGDRAYRARLSEMAGKRAEQFSIDATVEGILSVYRRALAAGHRA